MVAVLTPCSWLASYVLMVELHDDCDDEGDEASFADEPDPGAGWAIPRGCWWCAGGEA